MMQVILWLIGAIGLPFLLWSGASYSIVAVHIGHTLPSYLEIALAQARLFNSDCPIILIANAKAISDFPSCSNVTLIPCESLPLTPEHEMFQKRTKLNDQVQEGYWRYTSERFLYLYDYMVAYRAKNVFHIENDVLIYADLEKLLPIFQALYPSIATTFASEFKCVPGFVFIPHQKAMQKLAHAFAIKASKAMLDMKVLALFQKEHPQDIDCLPMMMEGYFLDHLSLSSEEKLLKRKLWHCQHIDQFKSIFDGAAMGVFLDGLDPAKGFFPPGTLMKELFNPSHIHYIWKVDEQGRNIPYALYKDKICRINNLHIASKRLQRFTSKEWPWKSMECMHYD